MNFLLSSAHFGLVLANILSRGRVFSGFLPISGWDMVIVQYSIRKSKLLGPEAEQQELNTGKSARGAFLPDRSMVQWSK